jgi:hypothetical protein
MELITHLNPENFGSYSQTKDYSESIHFVLEDSAQFMKHRNLIFDFPVRKSVVPLFRKPPSTLFVFQLLYLWNMRFTKTGTYATKKLTIIDTLMFLNP